MTKLVFDIDSHKYDITDKKPKGNGIFYQCLKCGTILPSNPSRPVRCECRNINLDPEMFKIGIREYSKFVVLKKVEQ